jgi:chorismate synthase
MAGNSFGQIFQIHSFGESHGPAMGVVIEGCPAGMAFDVGLLQNSLDQRRPGHQAGVSERKEADQAEILSGVFEGKTLGTPIAILVRNQDQRSGDYTELKENFRRGHADKQWSEKFSHRDHRGGGRSSGRETLSRVAGGAVAKMFIQSQTPQCKIESRIIEMGPHEYDPKTAPAFLKEAQQQGESFGGVVEVSIKNPPLSLGQPVFHKLKADFAFALMSIGATSAFELGEGVQASRAKGTEFHGESSARAVYGGISGGLSTGEEIQLRVHFKPTSSILDIAKKGRHDPFIGIRAAPVCEAMVALVLADHLLLRRLDNI